MSAKKLEYFGAEDRIGVKLLDEYTHFLTGEISEENINSCIKWIVSENLNYKADKVLTIYINSQGGDLYEALGLIDIMKASNLTIRTIGYGSIMSAAFLIFASGTKGERWISKNAGIMSHQFSSTEDVGKYHDIKATRKETDRLNKAMFTVLKEATELEDRIINKKLLPASDMYMTAEDMINYGAADYLLDGL